MSNFITVVRPLVDAFQVPVLLTLCVILIALFTRVVSLLWYFGSQRGQRPLVIRVDQGLDQTEDARRHNALDERLLAYLAADAHGNYVIAPGAGHPAAPGVMTGALDADSGWQAALLRLAFARQRSYLVDVAWPESGGKDRGGHHAVVRISRMPGGQILASDSFSEASTDELVQTVGCFCITFLRRQPKTLRHTPRWERWGPGIQGYRAYRSGLEHQRRAELRPAPDGRPGPGQPADGRRRNRLNLAEYAKALACFHEAARVEPANLLVQLHRGALLELIGKYSEAGEIYQKCRTLWPEHIETGYRLFNVWKNLKNPRLKEHLNELEKQLARRKLFLGWVRTFRPWRWNPGERSYWRSWIQLRLPGRVSRRATYLHAIAVAKLLARMSFLSQPGSCSSQTNSPVATENLKKATVEDLMKDLAQQILSKDLTPSWQLLLNPRLDSDDSAASSEASPSDILTFVGKQHRSDIGWLALFNAACFFSRAIQLPAGYIPRGFTAIEWSDACSRAAIRELGILVRNPRHGLEPDWLGTDQDLEALRLSTVGRAWSGFVGLREDAGHPGGLARVADSLRRMRPPAENGRQ